LFFRLIFPIFQSTKISQKRGKCAVLWAIWTIAIFPESMVYLLENLWLFNKPNSKGVNDGIQTIHARNYGPGGGIGNNGS